MIGVILAAGMAKRLRPLTDRMPKCLLKVGNRTLLERTIDAMAATGITEFVIVFPCGPFSIFQFSISS